MEKCKKRKKIAVKVSVLDSKNSWTKNLQFTNQVIRNSEILTKIGGLRLLYLCNSSSPKVNKIRKEIFTKEKSLSNRNLFHKPKLELFSQDSQAEKINLHSTKTLNSVSQITFDNPSQGIRESALPRLKEELFKGKIEDSPYNPKALSHKPVRFDSKSINSVARITLDSSFLPCIDNSAKIEKIVEYLQFKSKFREPFH